MRFGSDRGERKKKKKGRKRIRVSNIRVTAKKFLFLLFIYLFSFECFYIGASKRTSTPTEVRALHFFLLYCLQAVGAAPGTFFWWAACPTSLHAWPWVFFFVPSAFSFIQSCCYVPCATYCSVAASKTGANSSAFFLLEERGRELLEECSLHCSACSCHTLFFSTLPRSAS